MPGRTNSDRRSISPKEKNNGIYLYEIIFPDKIVPQVIQSDRIYTFEADNDSGFLTIHRYRVKNCDQMRRD